MNTLNSVSQDSGARQKEKSNSAGINGDGEIVNWGSKSLCAQSANTRPNRIVASKAKCHYLKDLLEFVLQFSVPRPMCEPTSSSGLFENT
jgi:hypothetical protein